MANNEATVGSLHEGEEFDFPKGIKLWDTPGLGTAIHYPIK